MKFILLLLFILFIFSIKSFCQQVDDFKKLQNLIELQIKKDNIRQKGIINIILKIEVKENEIIKFDQLNNIAKMNEFNQSFKRSKSFTHMGGYYLRLYLIASNEFSNDAKLELIRDNSSLNNSDQIIETLIDDASDLKVSYFDYHISKRPESFHLILQLNEKKAGRAFALLTVIRDNEYNFNN